MAKSDQTDATGKLSPAQENLSQLWEERLAFSGSGSNPARSFQHWQKLSTRR